MIQIDSNTIGNAAPISEWIEVMEAAFRDTAEDRIDVPQRVHINNDPNTLLMMPCIGEDYFSTKLLSVFPENLKGRTLIGIGSYKPDMREFPDEIIGDLDKIFVDIMHGITETGDLVIPLKKNIISEEQIIPISDLILGNVTCSGDTQFFKSVGMAAFDLYGARLVYENYS